MNKTLELVEIRAADGTERQLPTEDAVQRGFDYSQLDEKTQAQLIDYRTNIYNTFKQTLDSVVLLGAYFTEAKKLLKQRMFVEWVRLEFTDGPAGISHDSVNNWMRVFRTVRDNPEAAEALQTMNLKVVYKLCSQRIDEDVRSVLLRQAAEGTKLTLSDVQTIKKLNAEIRLREYNLEPECQIALAKTDIVEKDVRFLGRVSRLPKKKQKELAMVVETGRFEDVRDAFEQVISREPALAATVVEAVEVSEVINPAIAQEFEIRHGGRWQDGLKEISNANLIIAECPLRYDWRDSAEGLGQLSRLADQASAAGAFLIAIIGHKAIMGAEFHLSPFEPLHVLTLRKQPGQTRMIPGINIGSASVVAALSYKSPYRAPKKAIIDLQTWGGESPLGELDQVESGIEHGFHRWMESLVEVNDQVVHVVVEQGSQFNIRASLSASAKKLGAANFHIVG